MKSQLLAGLQPLHQRLGRMWFLSSWFSLWCNRTITRWELLSPSPLRASCFAFNVCLMILLTAFTWPLALGWLGMEKYFLISSTSQKLVRRALSNCFPLSVTVEWSIPNLHMMNFHIKPVILCFVILASGSTSAHLVKYSTVILASLTPFTCRQRSN